MSTPCIAIVGRPNVGKSSLFNMIARSRISIVDPTPGVTRDRVSVFVDVDRPGELTDDFPESKRIELIDTGGYGMYSGEDDDPDARALTADIEYQITQAVMRADLILFVIDAQAGIMPLDQQIARMLRDQRLESRVRIVANKVDGEGWEPHAMEAASLGFGEPWLVSALVGHRKYAFLGELYKAVQEAPERPAVDGAEAEPEVKLAIVGKRNAGKSTLVNVLAGEERVIVSEVPGTTRDAIDVRFEMGDRTLIAIDTAGVRKRKSLQDDIEFYSQQRATASIRRADVVLLMIDATVPVSQVDKKISQEIEQHHKPCVIAINKWDLVEGRKDPKGRPISTDMYEEYLSKEMPWLVHAPIVFISAKKSDGVRDLVTMAFTLYRQAGHRESTGRLNAFFQRVLARRGPSSRLGKEAKILYVTQVDVHPPTLAIVVNHRELFDARYERYLLNRIREELPFSEVPIRLIFRDRKRMALSDLKSGRRGQSEVDEAILEEMEAAEANDQAAEATMGRSDGDVDDRANETEEMRSMRRRARSHGSEDVDDGIDAFSDAGSDDEADADDGSDGDAVGVHRGDDVDEGKYDDDDDVEDEGEEDDEDEEEFDEEDDLLDDDEEEDDEFFDDDDDDEDFEDDIFEDEDDDDLDEEDDDEVDDDSGEDDKRRGGGRAREDD